MMSTLPLDMTSTFAPFGWGAAGLVGAGLVALLLAVVRADRRGRASADDPATAPGGAPRVDRLAA